MAYKSKAIQAVDLCQDESSGAILVQAEAIIPDAVGTFTTTSGGLATTTDAAVTLLTVPAGKIYHNLEIENGSGVAGWISWDSGATWHPWLTNRQHMDRRVKLLAGVTVQFKRISGGTNASGLTACAT